MPQVFPNTATAEFIQRNVNYNEQEDGLNFNGWYHVDDIKRILWKKFDQVDVAAKQNMLHPFVFFDGLDQFTLEGMLSPLINKLKNSPQKYFPFIFKPELASAHYISGFLRKEADQSVSIVLFNPTGTTPRVDFGNFAYTFRLLQTDRDGELESDSEPYLDAESDSDAIFDDELVNFDDDVVIDNNALYFQTSNGELLYTVINPEGLQITNSFTQKDLNDLGIVLDLNKPLTIDIIRNQLSPKAAELLNITTARGDTEKKIEIISSPHKLQTSEKDGGRLVSCGPLSLAFIEYVLGNPDYMANLDKAFHLPQFLNISEDDLTGYRKLVMGLRQKHYEILGTIDDKDLKSEIIDDSYQEMTNSVLGIEPASAPIISKDDVNADAQELPNRDRRAAEDPLKEEPVLKPIEQKPEDLLPKDRQQDAQIRNKQQEEVNKERTVREKQLSAYTQLLKKLENKRDELHKRYPKDSSADVTKAYGAACKLVNTLNGYAESYKNQQMDLHQFKEESSQVIKNARKGVLGEHRGYKEILTNLLLALGTLGVGYAIAALFTCSLTPIKCNTHTVNLLQDTEEMLDATEKMGI